MTPWQEALDQRAVLRPCEHCGKTFYGIGRLCNYHKKRENLYGTLKKLPQPNKLGLLTEIADDILKGIETHPAVAEMVAEVRTLFRRAPSRRPPRKMLTPSEAARYAIGDAGLDERFNPRTVIARAVVAAVAEKIAKDRILFPDTHSYKGWSGRYIISRYSKAADLYASQTACIHDWIYRIAKGLFVPLTMKTYERFNALLKDGDIRALKVWNHLQ